MSTAARFPPSCTLHGCLCRTDGPFLVYLGYEGDFSLDHAVSDGFCFLQFFPTSRASLSVHLFLRLTIKFFKIQISVRDIGSSS